ncbi:25128_t:CDS:2, partial [Racocetra persica]
NSIDMDSEKQLYKEVAQFLVDRISKADHFLWTYHKYKQLNNLYHNCGGTIRINIDQLNNLVV